MVNRTRYRDEIGQIDSVLPRTRSPGLNTVAFYDFRNGNANDLSGNGRNGTPSNITRVVEGASFNGTTSKITRSASGFPSGTNQRTFITKVKKTGTTIDDVVGGWGDYSTNKMFGNFIDNNKKMGLRAYVTDTTTNYVTTSGVFDVIVNTYDGTYRKLYVNGVLEYTLTKTLATGTTEFVLGANAALSSNRLNGVISYAIIEKRAWTPAEVANFVL